MLNISKKMDYALVALSHLALCHRQETGCVSARQLAEHYNLPRPLLMNIMKELAQAKIVHATRGVNGGYALSSPPSRTSLIDVAVAVDGPMKLADCAGDLPIVGQGCPIACDCPIREPIRELHRKLEQLFAGVTLEDLIAEHPQLTAEPAKQPA